jgi:hypothetical protein
MTIALGINFGSYVLLAADTRATYYDLSHRRVGCSDACEKIYKTSIGMVTGAGSEPLLNLVSDRFNEIDEIISTDQLVSIVNEERLRYRTLYPQVPEKSIKSTGWIFSYVTFAEGTLDKGTQTLRLGVIRSSGNIIGRRYLVNDYPYVIPPYRTTEEDFDLITSFLKKEIKSADQFETLPDSIEYHWSLLAKLIRTIQPDFLSISPYCQVGIHTLEGFTGISSILKDTDTDASIKLNPPPRMRQT